MLTLVKHFSTLDFAAISYSILVTTQGHVWKDPLCDVGQGNSPLFLTTSIGVYKSLGRKAIFAVPPRMLCAPVPGTWRQAQEHALDTKAWSDYRPGAGYLNSQFLPLAPLARSAYNGPDPAKPLPKRGRLARKIMKNLGTLAFLR